MKMWFLEYCERLVLRLQISGHAAGLRYPVSGEFVLLRNHVCLPPVEEFIRMSSVKSAFVDLSAIGHRQTGESQGCSLLPLWLAQLTLCAGLDLIPSVQQAGSIDVHQLPGVDYSKPKQILCRNIQEATRLV
jgi:hypothetical protein